MNPQLILAAIGSIAVIAGVLYGTGRILWLARRYLEQQYKGLLLQAAMNKDLKEKQHAST